MSGYCRNEKDSWSNASHTVIAPDEGNCLTAAVADSLEAPCIERLTCSHASGLKRGRRRHNNLIGCPPHAAEVKHALVRPHAHRPAM